MKKEKKKAQIKKDLISLNIPRNVHSQLKEFCEERDLMIGKIVPKLLLWYMAHEANKPQQQFIVNG